jgi:hypothetical protein
MNNKKITNKKRNIKFGENNKKKRTSSKLIKKYVKTNKHKKTHKYKKNKHLKHQSKKHRGGADDENNKAVDDEPDKAVGDETVGDGTVADRPVGDGSVDESTPVEDRLVDDGSVAELVDGPETVEPVGDEQETVTDGQGTVESVGDEQETVADGQGTVEPVADGQGTVADGQGTVEPVADGQGTVEPVADEVPIQEAIPINDDNSKKDDDYKNGQDNQYNDNNDNNANNDNEEEPIKEDNEQIQQNVNDEQVRELTMLRERVNNLETYFGKENEGCTNIQLEGIKSTYDDLKKDGESRKRINNFNKLLNILPNDEDSSFKFMRNPDEKNQNRYEWVPEGKGNIPCNADLLNQRLLLLSAIPLNAPEKKLFNYIIKKYKSKKQITKELFDTLGLEKATGEHLVNGDKHAPDGRMLIKDNQVLDNASNTTKSIEL